MNQPAPPQAAPVQQAPTAESGEGHDSFEANLAAMQEELRQEGLTGAPATEENAGAAPAAPAAQPADDQRAVDRRARLAKMRADVQGRVDSHARRQQSDRLSAELEAERKARAEIEQRAASYVDPSKLDEASFLALAERAQVTPEKLAEFIQKRMQNPERFAAEAAQRAVDPKLTALERRLAAQDERIEALLGDIQARDRAAAAEQMTNQFLGAVQQSGGIASRFLAAEGPEKFLKLVQRASEQLPAGAGQQALLDQLEETLETDGRRVYQQLHEIYGASAPPSNGTPPKPAAAKATTTVTNQIAQERASVVTDDDPMAGMSFDERVEYLKRHM